MEKPLPHSFPSLEDLDNCITTPPEPVIEAMRSCPGAVAVLGAGGKMGFHLSRMLQRASQTLGRTEPIRVVSRFQSSESRRKFDAAGFAVVPADLSDPRQVAKLSRAENVFFLAGLKFGTAGDPALLERFNVTMPGLVPSPLQESRIVALSTGCVYSFSSPESGGATEDSETDPPGAYARSCLGREAAFRDSGARTSLIRLNYAIDLRYGVLVDLARKVLDGQPIDVRTGAVNVIWQGDAVEQTIRTLPLAASPPFVLNVTGPEILRVRDLAQAFGERMGRDVRFEGTEAPTAWLSNSARSRKLFGPPRVSVDRMIEWISAWLERGGETLGKPTHFENRDGSYE